MKRTGLSLRDARFLAEVSSNWILSNLVLFLIIIIGSVLFTIFEGWPKYVGGFISICSILTIYYRRGLYHGFHDGYHHGHTDCLFTPKASTIDELLDEKNLEWSEEDKKDYAENIDDGLKNLITPMNKIFYKRIIQKGMP